MGMIPVVGEAFDAINGAIYAARGDALNASLSFAACVPVLGNVATGAKLVAKGVDKSLDLVKTVDKVVNTTKNVGRLGGPEHIGVIDMITKMNNQPGNKIIKEFGIDTTGGIKSTRYSDINITYANGYEMNFQVGKQTNSGIPVSRERAAISDIQNVGIPVTFVPYNNGNYLWYLAFWK